VPEDDEVVEVIEIEASRRFVEVSSRARARHSHVDQSRLLSSEARHTRETT